VIKKCTVAALVLSWFLFGDEGSCAQNGAAQTSQTVTARDSTPSIDQEIAMLRADLRSNRKQSSGNTGSFTSFDRSARRRFVFPTL
jgi:hypothetical protein